MIFFCIFTIMNIYNIGYNMNFYNTIDKVLSMNLDFVGTPCYNQNNYTFKVTKFFNKGNCCKKVQIIKQLPNKNNKVKNHQVVYTWSMPKKVII